MMHPENIKLFLKLNKPSTILRYLLQTRKLDVEIARLVDVPQDQNNHPEGNVFEHTCMVVDIAAEISERENMTAFDNAILRLAALTHDFGKFTHTQIYDDGRITAFGHPEAGVEPANDFLMRSKVNGFIIKRVLPLVKHHMAYVGFYTPDITSRSIRRLIQRIEPTDLQMLAYVMEADASGRGGKRYRAGLPERMQQILNVAATLDSAIDKYPDHLVSGDDIMGVMDIKPSPLLGKIKAALYKAQLEGRFHTREEGIFFLLHHVVIAEKDS